jgi:hypothetical protein
VEKLQTHPPVETVTVAEEKFERARRYVGLALAPLAFALVLLAPFDGLKPEAHRLRR